MRWNLNYPSKIIIRVLWYKLYNDGNTIAFNKTTTTSPKPTITSLPTATTIPSQDNQTANVVISNVQLDAEIATITNFKYQVFKVNF